MGTVSARIGLGFSRPHSLPLAGAITERYVRAAEVVVAGIIERTEEQLFGPVEEVA